MGTESRYQAGRKVSLVSLIVNIILSVIKIIVGFMFASQALVADGFHSVSDVISTMIVLMSIKVSQVPPDKEHPYGHGKAEAIATKLLGLILVGTSLLLIKSTITSILEGAKAKPGSLVLWVAFISIIAKELLYQYTIHIGEKINSKGLIADAHHHRSDAFSSIAALIGAGGAKLGFPILDPIAGLIVALFIAKVGVEILQDAIDELMDAIPNQDKMSGIVDQVNSLERVITVGDIKLRTYGPYLYVDLNVVVNNELTVVEGHKIAVEVKKRIKNLYPKVEEVMVHIDPESVYQSKN
ncbi:cation diffusion facilitator family transporter [Halobacteroides halobius DSM 5150]|uniref:Cation diffusion facilitator family transporter n=1 Tax=Halobacteroides halobius (strain ATCC 35273 / DSM 5150 / MD-1) TaxID=748449 RepID=L0KAR1_HALHC|nr:cation diffusion facilitator family transporter [Halobacteroides halobius]AGB41459.1 cation diffusion facilitator family transporter [Halobacteroides halobius DSM 5150]